MGRVCFAPNGGGELGFIELMIAAHENDDGAQIASCPSSRLFLPPCRASVLILFFGETPRNRATSSIVFFPGV